MNKRMRVFCEIYAQSPNATTAARDAGYSNKTAYSAGQRLLKNVEVQQYLKVLQANSDAVRVAGIDEIKAFWSDVIRDKENRMEHRLRASELLAKASGGFITEIKAEVETESHERQVIIYLPQQDPLPEDVEREFPDNDTVFLLPDNGRPVTQE